MTQYGVRGPDPRNTVTPAPSKNSALAMRLRGDVLMIKEGTCPHTNECRCPGGWRDSSDCENCGREVTTWHPYPDRLPREWTHAADGSWKCPDDSGHYAEPRP
jgi:hypothetical protein